MLVFNKICTLLIIITILFTLSTFSNAVEGVLYKRHRRDISMVGSLFQWFEGALEMLFGYFMPPKNGNARTRKHSTPRVSYKHYQLLRVVPTNEDELQELETLKDEPELDFWNPPITNRSADLIAPPDVAEYLREYLTDKDIKYTVLSSDLDADIKKQNPKIRKRGSYRSNLLKSDSHQFTWNRYHRYKEIMDYLDYLTKAAPKLVSIINLGKTNEGRQLQVAKVSAGKRKNNPAIWIDGGMHGREWISTSTALFVLKQIVENYQTNKAVVDSLDWYIMPLANPDGYEYSHTSDRFWRKNRSKKPKEPEYDDYDDEARFMWSDNEDCKGVDLNRNYDYHWGEVGASKDPCKPNFAGTKPFSEPETRAMSDFVMENGDKIKAFITLHSFSQMMLVPWGYTKQQPKDHDELMFVAKKAAEALQKVHGTEYAVGTSPTLMYPTSGSSDDWAKGRAGIKYSYTIELRDKGDYGFLLPASQIIPTGRETFAALKSIAKQIIHSK